MSNRRVYSKPQQDVKYSVEDRGDYEVHKEITYEDDGDFVDDYNGTEVYDEPSYDSYDNFGKRASYIDGEDRQIDDEVRNSRLASIMAGLGALLALLSTIISAALFFFGGQSCTGWHAVASLIAALFLGLCVYWGCNSMSRLFQAMHPNPGVTIAVFLGSLFAAVYFLIAAINLYFCRYG